MSQSPNTAISRRHAKCSPFAMYVDEKLAILDKRNRMIAEKKITDVIYEIEMIDVVTTLQQPETSADGFYASSIHLAQHTNQIIVTCQC